LKTFARLFALLLMSWTVLSCSNGEQTTTTDEEMVMKDSMALHVAIYPSEVCLPFYYAERTGIYDSLDVDVKMLHLGTMEDCDTALIRHRAEVSASDIARLICMRKDGFKATAITGLNGSLVLLSPASKRIKELKQLKERLVAIERHSETDYHSDQIAKSGGLNRLDVFRTQFNNHKLREEMLTNMLVEAAYLDEPFASFAIAEGAQIMWSRNKDEQSWTVLACADSVQNDQRIKEQIDKLIDGYLIAVDKLNSSKKDKAQLDSILWQDFCFTRLAVDTLSLMDSVKLQKAAPIKQETVDKAKQWLIEREWISSKLNVEGILK